MPLTPEELAHLMVKMDELGHEMAVHGAALKVTDRRSRWARTVGTIGVIAGIIGGVVGAGGVLVGASARATAEDVADARREAQVGSCIQANVTTERSREALVNGLLAILPPGQEPTEKQQEIVDRYTKQVEEALPFRSCSPAGIEAYLRNPPADPATVQTSSTTITR